MSQELRIAFSNCSDRGSKRAENQDSYGKFPEDSLTLATPKGQFFIVADGMGGHLAGEEASKMAIRLISKAYFSDQHSDIPSSLRRAFETANARIYDRSKSHPDFHGMGTTCTALVLQDHFAHIAHVGDSRAYRITRSQIEQLTQDHSKVAEMQRFGILTAEEARNHPDRSLLYSALGIAPAVPVDIIGQIPLHANEYYLLCTDGIIEIADREIKKIVASDSPELACRRLIDLANKRGGADNTTVQVIRVDKAASARRGKT